MSHALFEGLEGVPLIGDSSGLGSSEVRFEDSVPTITGNIITLDEEDVFQCGRCRKQFSSLPMFMAHKQQHAASAACNSLVSLEGKGTVLEVDTGGGGEAFDTLSQLEHSDLVSEAERVGQSIILSDEILFSIDQQVGEAQMLPPLEASTVQEVTSWEAVEDSMRMKLVESADDNDTSCLMDTPSSLAFEDALCATQQAVMEPACISHVIQSSAPPVKAPKLACGFCQKPFSKKFDLEQHIRSHTGEKPFQCVVCGRAFSQKSNVKKHMPTHKVWPKGRSRTLPKEPVQALVDESSPVEKSKQVKVIVDSSYVCQYCEKAFSSYFELKTHMKEHTEEKVYRCIQKNCNSTFADLTGFLEHTRLHESSSQFRCHACGKNFNSLEALGKHHYANTGALGLGRPCSKQKPREYPCSKCKSRFANPETLEHHLSSCSHRFECNLCMKVFACERYLRRHLQTHSSETSLFTCEICSKTFRTEHYLRAHKVTHSSEKPFQCTSCPASFNRKDKLSRHKLSHENLKRFKCPFKTSLGCKREFNRQDKLKQHILIHASAQPQKGKPKGNTRSSPSKKRESGERTTEQDNKNYKCPNCSVKLYKKQQEVCHKCHATVLWVAKAVESETVQFQTVRKGRKPKKTSIKESLIDSGMSTIEIIVVPMEPSKSSEQQEIQLNYQPAEISSEFMSQNSYVESSQNILFEENAKLPSDFNSSILLIQEHRAYTRAPNIRNFLLAGPNSPESTGPEKSNISDIGSEISKNFGTSDIQFSESS